MSTINSNDYQSLLSTLHRADLLSRRVADRQLLAHIGVSRSTFLILDMLARTPRGGVSQQAIADALGLTKAAVSRQMRSAEENRWILVRRSESSRRENTVMLTPTGRKLLNRGRRLREAAEREAVDALGIRDIRAATATLQGLCAHLDRSVTAERPARVS
jgi:DNA-binding MarR family transcriptional regulator